MEDARAVEPKREVPNELGIARERTSTIVDKVNALGSRLGDFMASEKAENKASGEKNGKCTTVVGAYIAGINDDLEKAITSINSIIHRLEL